MQQRLFQILGIATMSALFACSAVASDDGDTQVGEVQGGKTDTVVAHNYAVGIQNKLGAICSGTLIAPNLVLTARHCVVAPSEDTIVTCDTQFGPNTAPANLSVTTDPVIRGAKDVYQVVEITTPDDTGFCGNDIALVRLAKNIPAEEAEPAVPVVNFAVGDTSRLSGQIAALGYGITAPNASDQGTRHIRQKIDIICVPGNTEFDCAQTPYSSMIDNDREFITQGYVCAGDSGSGAFDQSSFSENGAPFVLGALSRGPSNDTTCLAAIYSRTDTHKDLLVNTAKKAAESGNYDAADWVKGVVPTAVKSVTPAPTVTCNGDTCTSTDATDPAAPDGTTTVTKTTGGCSEAPGSTSGGLTALFGLALVVAAKRRRR